MSDTGQGRSQEKHHASARVVSSCFVAIVFITIAFVAISVVWRFVQPFFLKIFG
jgi:hypothetical protein